MGLKNNILNNSIANILQKVVKVLEQLFLVPFFITSWGAAYYGEWLTLTIIPSILAFSDLGFGSAAANSFVLKYAAGDKQGAANISKTGFVVVSLAVFLGIVLSGVVLFLGVHFGWFAKSLISVDDAVKSISFLMAARLISFYNQLFNANFRASRRVALSINLITIGSLLNIVAGLMVLLLKGSVIQYALWQLIASTMFNIVYWRCAVMVLGSNKEYLGTYDKSVAKEICSTGFGFMLIPAWQTILFQGTTFVVRIVLGPVAVAVFNTVRTLSRSVNQLYSIVNSSVQPELQYEIGARNMKKAQKIFIYAIRVSLVLALSGVAFLALFGLPVYNWWTQKALMPPTFMWYIFLIGILCNAVWWTAAVVFGAVNKPYRIAVSGIMVAIVAIIISYFCCQIWGLNGAAIGSLVFEVIMMLYVLPVSCRMMNIRFKEIFEFRKPKNNI